MRAIIIVLLVICSYFAHAQTIGTVNNRANEPIEFATVLLLSTADSSVLKYTMTDNQGKFSIKGDLKGKYIIQVRNISYTTKDTLVTLPATQDIFITLEEDITALGEVVVQGSSRSEVKWSSDTIKYDVKRFSDGSEQVLSELLNKLPGIDVDTKGVTRVHGKVIDKFLVDGSDVFGANSQLAVNNISADMVENIEVLNNYSEYSIMDGFRSYDKTAINIGIDKSKSKGITGDALLSGGYDAKYLARLNLMRLRGKSMLSFIGSGNNIGDEVFSIEEYLKLQVGIGDIMSNGSATLSLSNAEVEMLMPQKDVYKRSAGVAALNWA